MQHVLEWFHFRHPNLESSVVPHVRIAEIFLYFVITSDRGNLSKNSEKMAAFSDGMLKLPFNSVRVQSP